MCYEEIRNQQLDALEYTIGRIGIDFDLLALWGLSKVEGIDQIQFVLPEIRGRVKNYSAFFLFEDSYRQSLSFRTVRYRRFVGVIRIPISEDNFLRDGA